MHPTIFRGRIAGCKVLSALPVKSIACFWRLRLGLILGCGIRSSTVTLSIWLLYSILILVIWWIKTLYRYLLGHSIPDNIWGEFCSAIIVQWYRGIRHSVARWRPYCKCHLGKRELGRLISSSLFADCLPAANLDCSCDCIHLHGRLSTDPIHNDFGEDLSCLFSM